MISELWEILPGYVISLTEEGPAASSEDWRQIDGTAIIDVNGPTSKFGGGGTASSMVARAKLRNAIASPEVDSVMLTFDSPGGTVSGTHDFAMDVRNASAIKPTFAYGSDMMASAAYHVASQAGRVFANPSAFVGSIGVVSTLVDASQLAETQGVKVHQVSSGGMKGMGTFGTPITAEHLAYQQDRINQVTDQFIESVAVGRGMQSGAVRSLADGRVHIAADAARLGLIDSVVPFEQSLGILRDYTNWKRGR